jgi:hypothetical protein
LLCVHGWQLRFHEIFHVHLRQNQSIDSLCVCVRLFVEDGKSTRQK